MDATQLASVLGDKVLQMFLTYGDGSNTFPLAFFAKNANTKLTDSVMKHLCPLIKKLEDTNKFTVAWTSSDGDPQNMELEDLLRKHYPNIFHIYDCQHIIKNIRNALLNNDLAVVIQDEKIIFNCKTLGDAIDILKLKLDPRVLNPNKLKWEPVKCILNIDTTILTTDSTLRFQALGTYLKNMKDLYDCLYNNNMAWSIRSTKLGECAQYFQKVQGLPAPTLHHITVTTTNLKKLVGKWRDVQFRFSSLGTLVVENFFSILRAKNPVFSVAEYARLHSQAYLVMQIKFSDPSDLGFSVPKFQLGKNYCDIDIVLKCPTLKRKNSVSRQHQSSVISLHIQGLLHQFRPIKNFVTIGTQHKCRAPVYLSCPVDGCSCKKLYSYPKCLANHLQTAHGINKSLANTVTKEMKVMARNSESTVIDSSQTLQEHMDFTESNIISQTSTGDTDVGSIPVGSIVVQLKESVQQNGLSTTQRNKVNCASSECKRTSAKKCSNGRCAKCCKIAGGCVIHGIKCITSNIFRGAHIVLLDTETTGFHAPIGLTDLYCVSMNTRKTLAFPSFINSGINITANAAVKTGITDADVENGTAELEVVQQFVDLMNESDVTVIVCHNARFDRDVLMQVYSRHHRNLSSPICNKRLVFVDSIPLFRTKLPGLKNYDLGTVYEYLFHKSIANQHRAQPDVEGMEQILNTLSESHELTVEDMIFQRASDVDIHTWHRMFDDKGLLINPSDGLPRYEDVVVRTKCSLCSKNGAKKCANNCCKQCCIKSLKSCSYHNVK